ncbi:MAG: hypothetical protein HXK20_01045 [Alloprevotella tannerae]|jgi:hypothetical protein|nr:hypothetical protein [Alloprevotella tannerae]
MIMFYNLNKEQQFPSPTPQVKHYIAPCISVIVMEAVHFIATSDPQAGIQDINYGGDLTDDIDDQ